MEVTRTAPTPSSRFLLACAVLILAVLPCAAIGADSIGMTGTLAKEDPSDSSFFRASFSCYGTPTCTGVFTVTERDPGCTNVFSFSGEFIVTGVDLSHPGTFGGTATSSVDSDSPANVNGPCTYTLHAGSGRAYTATWDGVRGTLTVFDNEGSVAGTFTATGVAPPPSFPMTVTSQVTSTAANVSAQIQPRTTDAGNTNSVFVFAYAPQSIVAGGGKRAPAGGTTPVRLLDGPDPCVLAQVNANGQLTGASASTLQAYTTSVLTSQGQAVTILDNVSTPNVAGATM